MQKLNLPTYSLKLKEVDGQIKIFDEIRKKWLLNTPEEWVRQHLVHFLVQEYGYPLALIQIEKSLKVNGLDRRADIILSNKKGEMLLLVECKAPQIKVDQKVFDQIAQYNLSLQVPYLLVSNGLTHICCTMDHKKQEFQYLENIPKFSSY